MPNMGQICAIEPVRMKYDQPTTTRPVERIVPGIQSVRSRGFQMLPSELLHHEAADARAGVDRGQDEEGLEHDGEVVPVRHQPPQGGEAGEDLGEAHGQRHRAPRASGHVLADLARELGEVDGREAERRVDERAATLIA